MTRNDNYPGDRTLGIYSSHRYFIVHRVYDYGEHVLDISDSAHTRTESECFRTRSQAEARMAELRVEACSPPRLDVERRPQARDETL